VKVKTDAKGQTLVLFALFLTVLLGASALAVDYANWLLTDRSLQNVADHAALAGASVFGSETPTGSCGAGVGVTNCLNGRAKAWRSLNQELTLGLTDSTISCLAGNTPGSGGDTPVGGWKNASAAGCTATSFQGQTIWVDTPPPSNTSYTSLGGGYATAYGVMFVRVDRPARTYFAGVMGLSARDRTGWATAGVLPTDFALSVYCRNNLAPENGVCAAGGDSIGIDGQGGITLAKGDIGSNESLQVTASSGTGVIMKAGNVFLVEGSCGSSTWACPPATTGGITDGSGVAKNAFFIPPIPVPNYALPGGVLADPSKVNTTCSSSSTCVPGTGASNATPIDWTCFIGTGTGSCGTPQITTVSGASHVVCNSNGTATQDLRPTSDGTKSNWNGTVSGSSIYPNLNETSVDPSGTSIPTPPTTTSQTALSGSPTSYAYSDDGADGATYITYLNPPNGTLQSSGYLYLRYTLFKVRKSGGSEVIDNTGNAVTVTAQLQQGGVDVAGYSQTKTASSTITEYDLQVPYSVITNPNSLSIKFTVHTTKSTGGAASNNRGAALSWAEVYLDQLPVPPPPPMIPPGLYRSIVIPSGGCAVLDPTAYYGGGLKQYQEPGIYYFEDANGGGQKGTISLGDNSVLIGDGVTLVFDSNWSDPSGTGGQSSAQGLKLGSNAALVLNSATSTYNPSSPLPILPSDALSAAWAVDPTNTTTGMSTWGGPCASPYPCVLARSSYAVTSNYRGVTFYFKPKTNGSASPSGYSILGRFAMGGNVSGIDFQGIMYAPYDDVQISGANGFDTVGMVLAWTAKFNGGSASITLDYPYARVIGPPYLLEPTVNR
jgi:Putative Flp pilus-assembly TadE/G-like